MRQCFDARASLYCGPGTLVYLDSFRTHCSSQSAQGGGVTTWIGSRMRAGVIGRSSRVCGPNGAHGVPRRKLPAFKRESGATFPDSVLLVLDRTRAGFRWCPTQSCDGLSDLLAALSTDCSECGFSDVAHARWAPSRRSIPVGLSG